MRDGGGAEAAGAANPVGGLAVIWTRWQRVVVILGVDITNLKRRERKGGATGGGRRGRLVVLDTFDQSSATTEQT